MWTLCTSNTSQSHWEEMFWFSFVQHLILLLHSPCSSSVYGQQLQGEGLTLSLRVQTQSEAYFKHNLIACKVSEKTQVKTNPPLAEKTEAPRRNLNVLTRVKYSQFNRKWHSRKNLVGRIFHLMLDDCCVKLNRCDNRTKMQIHEGKTGDADRNSLCNTD